MQARKPVVSHPGTKGMNTNLLIPLREYLPLPLRWMNDKEVTKFLRTEHPLYEMNEEQWLETFAKNRLTDNVFMIATGKNKPIGVVGLHRIDGVSRHATLGIAIGEKTYWGKRHGTEAMMLILHHGFVHLNLRKIELDVHAFNERATRCYIRCGFVEEGRKKEHTWKDGAYHDTVCMGVFRDAWLPLWEAFTKDLSNGPSIQ